MVFPFFVPIRLEDCPVCEVWSAGKEFVSY